MACGQYDLLAREAINIKSTFSIVLGGVALLLFFSNAIPLLNLLLLPVFAAGLYAITKYSDAHKAIKLSICLFTLSLGFFIAIYRPDNFNYPLIWQFAELYEGAKPFSLHANTSKALGGYLVIVWLMCFAGNKAQRPLGVSIFIATVAAATILLMANLVFGVEWQPKLPEGLPYFIAVNLGITVIAEEAFFRLLIQRQIANFFSNSRAGTWFAAGVATLLFALAHTATLGPALLIFLIAGAVYSGVYAYTQRLSMAVCAHFGVNILHFLLLEYPLPL